MECCIAKLIKTRNQPFKKEMNHLPLSLLTDGFCSLLPLNVTRHISIKYIRTARIHTYCIYFVTITFFNPRVTKSLWFQKSLNSPEIY